MRRRHLVVVVSAVTLLAIVFIAVVSIGIGVKTNAGRAQIRALIQKQVGSRVHGRLHVGAVKGGLLTGLSIDSLEIRGEDDSLFLSTGKVTVQYNPRDLLDRRLLLRNVQVEHPVLRVQQYPTGDWNHQRIFRKTPSVTPNVPGRGFGDFVVLDSVTVRNGSVVLGRRWSPNDSLRGAKRDSAIRFALADSTREIRRAGDAFTFIHRWTSLNAFLPHVRIAHPDSGRFGREFVFARSRAEESYPPFSFRNANGTIRQLGDSLFLDIPRFDLPASTGSAVGRVWWGSNLPQRYDIRIRGDSVALKDIAWIYPTLPRDGGGRTDLHIRNNATNLNVIEYALTGLDVRSQRSRLVGAMTFVVGTPVLGVTDVDLRGAPINFDLVRTLAGEPLPVDWQGDLFGTVRGPGGPLTHFVIDSSQVTFRDAHVRGAVSRFSGRGELDILLPAFTVFHGFHVSTSLLDLRSVQFLYPLFPKLGGTVWGSATLDSSWLDLRFSKGDISHSNGPGDPTRMTGSGRVTYGEKFMKYDVAMHAEPISLTMMSRAYQLGIRGLMKGPITAKGQTDNLKVTADLTGPAGRITYDGTVDVDGLTYGLNGQGLVETMEPSRLVDRDQLLPGWMTGEYRLNVAYDTTDIATMKGSATFALERSEFEGMRVFQSRAVARFDDRRMFLDTLRVESTAATIDASGAIGLGADRSDSITFFVDVDSLGGLRSYLRALVPTRDSATVDSLSGTLSLRGTLAGSIRALRVSGTLSGTNVVMRTDAGRQIDGAFVIADPFTAPTGSLSLRSKVLKVAGVALDTLGFTLRFNEGKNGAFSVSALSTNSATALVQGEFARSDGTTLVSLRSGSIIADKSRWHLAGPVRINMTGSRVSIDSLVLLNGHGGRVALSTDVPASGSARFLFRSDSLPLSDVGMLAQLRAPMSGLANITVAGAGTRQAPVFTADATVLSVSYGGLRVDSAQLHGTYAANRAEVQLKMARDTVAVIEARGSLPVELRYFGARMLDDSLHGRVRTGDATLDLLQAFVPAVRNATGRLLVDVAVSGSWKHPDISGSISVENGEATLDTLGIRLRGIQVDLGLFGHADSLAVRRMVAWSGATPADSISLSGQISYRDLANPLLGLRLDARNFRAIDKRTLARLEVSTDRGGVTLRGSLMDATLSGGVIIERGTVYLPDPELARKQSVDVRTQFPDTSSLIRAASAQEWKLLQTTALQGVRVTIGDDVALRSPEADIRITGVLEVERGTVRSDDSVTYRLVFDGTLRADRGTYKLNLLEAFQREFTVEPGGTIVFYPSPDLYPVLNISALHAVKRANQADLRIRVRLTGPIYPPPLNVSLESAESYSMSQTDMVSYLIFGVPSFALGEQEARTNNLALQTFLPTGQVLLAYQLSRFFSPFGAQIRPGALNADSIGTAGGWKNMLYTSRIAGDYQVSNKVYLSVSTGLCSLDPTNTGSTTPDYLSGKIEYRFSSSTAVRASREPPTSAQNCGRSVTGRAFIPTPSQWGVSLSKSWRF